MKDFLLLGLFYSCGSVKSKNKFELQTKRQELATLFFELSKRIGKPKMTKTNNSFTVLLINKNLGDKFKKNIGLESKIDKKELPVGLLNNTEKRISFLRGYFEGKSSVSVKNRIIKISGKKEQLEQLKKLLELENINAGIYKNRKYFSLYIEGKNKCLIFKEKIGFLTKEKNEKLENLVSFSVG